MCTLAEIHRPHRQQHAGARWKIDHVAVADVLIARSTDPSSAVSVPGATLTTAPASLISIVAAAAGFADASASAAIGTHAGAHLTSDAASSPTSTRASRRH